MLSTIRTHTEHILGSEVEARKQHTFSCVVAGIIEARSTVAAEIGRAIPGEADAKHKIKQVDRFLNNESFNVEDVSRGLLRMLNVGAFSIVLVALDWTTTGNFETLTSSVVLNGRALPFHWTVIDKNKTRMAVAERDHVRELKSLLPAEANCTLLFDAGFDDSKFVALLEKLKLPYIVRSTPKVSVRRVEKRSFVDLSRCRWKRGVIYDWGEIEYTRRHKTRTRFIAIHDHKMQGPWLLLTNLDVPACTIIKMYGRRFETEETYKDLKDVRSGLQLKGTRVESIRSLQRLIAAAATAYFIMVTAGLYGEEKGLHRSLQANTVKSRRVLAVWRVGRHMLRKGVRMVEGLLTPLKRALELVSAAFSRVPCLS